MKQNNSLGIWFLISKSRYALLAWSMLLIIMFSYVVYDKWEDAERNALIAARSLIDKDILYRKWNAMHGGVYAPVTEKTPPNPYLTQLPERDIETPSGRKLTLINPAYMTRQVHELENKADGSHGHITSLKLLRPENKADDWEEEALKAFERGQTEVSSVDVVDGKKYLRVIHPLKTDKSCLKCHAFQGYKEGDIRGGISASIPMQPFNAGLYRAMAKEGLIYLIYWLVGAGLILSRARGDETNTLALKQSEEKFRILFEQSMDAMLLLDGDKFIECNPAAINMLRCAKPELLITHPWNLSPPVQPDGRSSAEKANEMIDIAYKNGGHRFEWVHRRMDGEDFPVEVTLIPVPLVSGHKILYTTWRDISSSKQAENNLLDSEKMFRIMSSQFTALLNAIPDSITLLSSDYRILWANRVAGNRVGLEPTVMEGEYCYSLWFNRDTACEECPVRESFQSGEPAQKTVIKKDRHIEVRAVPVRGPDGVVNVIRVGRDITEQIKLEDQLRQSQKMESVGTLAGGVAHDFNNILSSIIGYGQLAVMKMEPDNPYRKNVEQMLTAADKAAYLTQGLLSFSRKQMSNRVQVNLNELIKKTEMFLRRVIGADIEFRTNLFKNPLLLLADPNQIEQVLMNLVTNACDAMATGGVLTITTEQIQLDEEFSGRHGDGKPGSYGLITVSDSGFGMGEEIQQRIFEPFFTTKEVGKGTGLGLAIIYGIIKQHEGFIDLYSEPGKGTAFRVYLPLIESAGKETTKVDQSEYPAGGTETILLAEDDEMLRKLAKSVLEEFGYKVIAAVDGEDAISKFVENKGRIDLLLTDLIMPKKSGKEVYEEVQKIRPGIKTIFASGYSPDIVRDKVSLGKDATIVYKPISPMDLLKKVRSVLDGVA
jgi:two-component system cell cycle sensor histidine kinase/response regulator CckA